MCVIIWSPKGTIPKNHVLNAMMANQDGWGFAVANGKSIATFRSVDHEEFLSAWVNRIKGPVLFHARWATHGAVVKSNCHPFRMPKHKMVVAHNGVIPKYGSKNKSDTIDFIERVLEPLPEWFLEEESVVEAITEVIGNSKLVFLRHDGTAEILNEQLGVWMNGIWYSNSSAFREPSRR